MQLTFLGLLSKSGQTGGDGQLENKNRGPKGRTEAMNRQCLAHLGMTDDQGAVECGRRMLRCARRSKASKGLRVDQRYSESRLESLGSRYTAKTICSGLLAMTATAADAGFDAV